MASDSESCGASEIDELKMEVAGSMPLLTLVTLNDLATGSIDGARAAATVSAAGNA